MNQSVIAILSAALLGISAPALADLAQQMDILNKNLATVKKTKNADELKQALAAMREAARKSISETPERLEGKPADSAEMRDYRAYVDRLISEIDISIDKANAGDIVGAKAQTENFERTRNESHRKFR